DFLSSVSGRRPVPPVSVAALGEDRGQLFDLDGLHLEDRGSAPPKRSRGDEFDAAELRPAATRAGTDPRARYAEDRCFPYGERRRGTLASQRGRASRDSPDRAREKRELLLSRQAEEDGIIVFRWRFTRKRIVPALTLGQR